MRLIFVILLTAVAGLAAGCDASSVNGFSASALAPVESSGPTQNCYPLTQMISFSGTATLSATSAASGTLDLGLVTGVVNTSVPTVYSGTSSDGEIVFNSYSGASGANGFSQIQGFVRISDAAWNQMSQVLGNSEIQCVQSMSFDLEVSDPSSGSSSYNLYGGQILLTVNGTQYTLAF